MTPFFKLSAAGNDFLALAEPEVTPDPPQVAAWCQRRISVGADGLFVVRRRHPTSGERCGPHVVTVEHLNADGSPVDLCFNGARCAARLAFHLGWAADRVIIETAAGALEAQATRDDLIRVEAPSPQQSPDPMRLRLGDREVDGWRVVTGVPHFVLFPEGGVATAEVASIGSAIRHHQALQPTGANVDFIAIPTPQRLEVRTFERGVEAETLACGSGVLAAALVGLELAALTLPAEVVTSGGAPVRLEGTVVNRHPTQWSLVGEARLVAVGELTPAAATVHDPPAFS